MIALRTWRKNERFVVRKTRQTGTIAAVNDNAVVAWLDNGSTMLLEPVDADLQLQVLR